MRQKLWFEWPHDPHCSQLILNFYVDEWPNCLEKTGFDPCLCGQGLRHPCCICECRVAFHSQSALVFRVKSSGLRCHLCSTWPIYCLFTSSPLSVIQLTCLCLVSLYLLPLHFPHVSRVCYTLFWKPALLYLLSFALIFFVLACKPNLVNFCLFYLLFHLITTHFLHPGILVLSLLPWQPVHLEGISLDKVIYIKMQCVEQMKMFSQELKCCSQHMKKNSLCILWRPFPHCEPHCVNQHFWLKALI